MQDITRKKDTGEPGNGGQFGTTTKAASGLSLNGDPKRPPVSDTTTLIRIADMLGADEEWDGSADFLEEVANMVAATGRPHPGDARFDPDLHGDGREPDDYRAVLAEWEAAQPPAATPREDADRRTVSRIANALGAPQSWSSEYLDEVASAVASSGRPHPGTDHGITYATTLQRWNLDRQVDGYDQYGTWMAVAAMGRPVMQGVLATVGDRDGEGVADALSGLDAQRVSLLYMNHVAPAKDQLASDVAEEWDGPRFLTTPNDEAAAATRHVLQVCSDAGTPTVGELLVSAYQEGKVPTNAMWDFDEDTADAMYDKHVGPAVDAIETELTGHTD